jgi:hypothetical protein
MSQTKAQLLAPIGIITCPGLDVTVGGSSPFQVGSTGIITAVSASFSGDVAVGGTLTYEDVTNIDSVGLITARKGINVTAGVSTFAANIDANANINANGNIIGDNSTNISGIASVTATTLFGDGAGLTNLPASGGVVSGIASGSITGGKGVLVADDGKLLAVAGDTAVRGTQASAQASSQVPNITYDKNADKFVLFYVDTTDSDKLKAKVGTLSGTTFTWGSSATASTNICTSPRSFFDAGNNKIVCGYKDSSDSSKGKVVVGTVSGTSITFGTPVDVIGDSIQGSTISLVYIPNSNHNYAFICRANNTGYCRIGKYTGTNSSTWPNSSATFFSGRPIAIGGCWDSTANKLVIAYGNYDSTERGELIAGTVSASDSVTFGSVHIFDASRTDYKNNVVHDSIQGTNVVVWREGSNGTNYYILALTATLSGTNFTFGDTVAISKNDSGTLVPSNYSTAVYDENAKQVLAAYVDSTDSSNTVGYTVALTVSGSTITASSPTYKFQSIGGMESSSPSSVYDPDLKKNVIVTSGTGGSFYFVESLRSSNVTEGNYVGLSQASYTDGQTAKISVTGSINEAVSGLVVGNKYYVIADGTLSTTADSGNITAGIPLATNKLLLK